MLPVSCFGSTTGRCISTVSSPARVLGVGGTFERVDQFGGFLGVNWGGLAAGAGKFALDAIPTVLEGGIKLGFTFLTANILRGQSQAPSQTPRQQVATTSQGSFDLAVGEAQAEQRKKSEDTLNMVLGIAATAVVVSILLSRRR